MLHAVIMAGGSGTRFWPASRTATPKQLLDLTGGQTMIQGTVSRLGQLVSPDRVLVVTNQRLVDPIRAQLPDVPPAAIIGEPCRRDTAPCVGLAAAWIARNDPDATMVVMPADHVIAPDEEFQGAMRYAEQLVAEDPTRLVTFGIRPTYPAEIFGYIERGDSLHESNGTTAYRVRQFHEKPKLTDAKRYLEAGSFYWNSGIFVWRVATILDELKRHEPAMHQHLMNIAQSVGTSDFEAVFEREFAAIEGKSIDYAVMEKAPHVVVIEAPFDWDDLGSWQALSRLKGVDKDGNTLIGRHLGIDTKNSIVRTDEGHLVVTVGIEDCIVVHTDDATLVAHKDQEEAIRNVVKQLEQRGWKDHL
jgi:mannose-1-phosphate guanylyltransferase